MAVVPTHLDHLLVSAPLVLISLLMVVCVLIMMNVVRLECAPMGSVSIWMALSNVNAKVVLNCLHQDMRV